MTFLRKTGVRPRKGNGLLLLEARKKLVEKHGVSLQAERMIPHLFLLVI
ncbi:hypothetical protein SAMN05192559_104231 [Halobacillus karajensis]|nr:hypothetical protein SAMN05192559_104231 [Halobacillus karajensis]